VASALRNLGHQDINKDDRHSKRINTRIEPDVLTLQFVFIGDDIKLKVVTVAHLI